LKVNEPIQHDDNRFSNREESGMLLYLAAIEICCRKTRTPDVK
jgi:hypothetical protein